MIDQFACGHLHQPFDCADIAISVDEIATPLPLPLAIISTENNIRVVNLLVVAADGGTGVLVGTIVSASDNEDALLGVAINGTVAQLTGKNTLPKNSPIIFEGPRANAKAILPGFGAQPGTHVRVTMFFARAGEITKNVIVRDNTEEYVGITSSPAPQPQP